MAGCGGKGAQSASAGGTDTGAQRGYGHDRPALAGAGPGQVTLGAAREVRRVKIPSRARGAASAAEPGASVTRAGSGAGVPLPRGRFSVTLVEQRILSAGSQKRPLTHGSVEIGMHDVFICHASEDKDAIARPLAVALQRAGVGVWFDEFSLQAGDSLLACIQRGLIGAKFGVVIFSPTFFEKAWPQSELQGLFAQEVANGGSTRILPVWHEVDAAFVASHAPLLSDRVALRSADGVERVARGIVERVRPVPLPIVLRPAVSYEVKGKVEVHVHARVRCD